MVALTRRTPSSESTNVAFWLLLFSFPHHVPLGHPLVSHPLSPLLFIYFSLHITDIKKRLPFSWTVTSSPHNSWWGKVATFISGSFEQLHAQSNSMLKRLHSFECLCSNWKKPTWEKRHKFIITALKPLSAPGREDKLPPKWYKVSLNILLDQMYHHVWKSLLFQVGIKEWLSDQ